jgi:hypothetical protein
MSAVEELTAKIARLEADVARLTADLTEEKGLNNRHATVISALHNAISVLTETNTKLEKRLGDSAAAAAAAASASAPAAVGGAGAGGGGAPMLTDAERAAGVAAEAALGPIPPKGSSPRDCMRWVEKLVETKPLIKKILSKEAVTQLIVNRAAFVLQHEGDAFEIPGLWKSSFSPLVSFPPDGDAMTVADGSPATITQNLTINKARVTAVLALMCPVPATYDAERANMKQWIGLIDTVRNKVKASAFRGAIQRELGTLKENAKKVVGIV